jgi:hypothetical protein
VASAPLLDEAEQLNALPLCSPPAVTRNCHDPARLEDVKTSLAALDRVEARAFDARSFEAAAERLEMMRARPR